MAEESIQDRPPALSFASARPFVHVIGQGEPGSGKTTFGATFPTPLKVYSFDPWGKESPYLRLGQPTGPIQNPQTGFFFQEVYSPDPDAGTPPSLLARIEYFSDPDPTQPAAWETFRADLNRLQLLLFNRRLREGGEIVPATVIFDSATLMEICCRKNSEYKINPQTKEPRQWFSYSTNQLEEVLMVQAGSLPCNVLTLCHTDAQKDEIGGRMLRNPMLPGRLRSSAQGAYGEMYTCHAFAGADGKTQYLLQTARDQFYNCSSMIGAPNGCAQEYEALWGNYPPTRPAIVR